MTNTEFLATIQATIENWIKETDSSQFSKGERFGYNRVIGLLYSLTYDREDLDDAAYKYAIEHKPSVYGLVDVVNAFEAGAEWVLTDMKEVAK